MSVLGGRRKGRSGANLWFGTSPLTSSSRLGSFFLNISSMRWVTRKPPNTLTAANPTASPHQRAEVDLLGPAARMAPTMMTEEMALVTDISGVCSAGVTFQIT